LIEELQAKASQPKDSEELMIKVQAAMGAKETRLEELNKDVEEEKEEVKRPNPNPNPNPNWRRRRR